VNFLEVRQLFVANPSSRSEPDEHRSLAGQVGEVDDLTRGVLDRERGGLFADGDFLHRHGVSRGDDRHRNDKDDNGGKSAIIGKLLGWENTRAAQQLLLPGIHRNDFLC